MARTFPCTITSGDHTLEVNPLSPGEMMDFFEAFTTKQVSSPAWARFAMWICSVRTFDGVPVEFPRNGMEVKALANRLGHEGVVAVQKVINGEEGEAAVDEVDLEKAKN